MAPNPPDFLKHGRHKAASLLRAHPNADLGYTDGSNVHEKHSGGAAVLVNSGEEGTMVHYMRVRESSPYPAELWALYLVLTYVKKTLSSLWFPIVAQPSKKWPPLKVAPASTTHTHTPTYLGR